MPRFQLLPICAVMALCAQAFAQARTVASLDGLWQLRVLGPREATTWRDAHVPAAFENVLGADFDGIVEYRRGFTVPKRAPGDRVFVRFAAVMTEAKVLFNGVEVGRHLGGWTPFRCLLPERVFREGEQELRVVVDEKVGHNTQGFLPAIQPHFGGIWQSVTLQHYKGQAFDPDCVELRARLDGEAARVEARFDALFGGVVRLEVRDGDEVCASVEWPIAETHRSAVESRVLTIPGSVRAWQPGSPHLYDAVLTYRPAREAPSADRIERKLAFREVAVRGRQISLNGKPLQVRGVLHWGYGPPRFAPNPPDSVWRDEMRWAKACGFNMIKACLWMPPPSFFDVALEQGMLVWQEYPTWHPDFSPKHKDALLREYGEFFALDRGRAPVVVRSLTCETGRGAADATVIQALFEQCKRETGAVLVEDDSSWIAWNRFHDFYDDHPYGNCGPWVARLRGFDAHIAKHGDKPFLLGEAIASDTWLVPDQVRAMLAGDRPWWTPFALGSMQAFEGWVREWLGSGAVTRLLPDSLEYAMAARKYQMEAFRRLLPDAGYVASVMRDFRRARMGFFDDFGRAKWQPEQFAWHGEHMLVLDDPRAIRSLAPGVLQTFTPQIRVAGDLDTLREKKLSLSTHIERWTGSQWEVTFRSSRSYRRKNVVAEAPLLSKVVNPAGSWDGAVPRGRVLRRCLVDASLDGVTRNRWTFYSMPDLGGTGAEALPENVRVARVVTPELLTWVENGGRLLLLPGGRGSLKSERLWFLQGAPFAPEQHALFESVPRDLLFDLQPLDFDGPVFRLSPLAKQFDVLLGFWDTHDEKQSVQEFAFLLETRAGKGRILACSLNLDLEEQPAFDRAGSPGPVPARAWLRRRLISHLVRGEPARSELRASDLTAWRQAITAEKIEIGGTWLLQPDKDDKGRAAGWMNPDFDDSKWIRSRSGKHWEAAGLPHHDGIAWYRKRFQVPASWRPGKPLYLVFDGVDDSYVLYVNGKRVAAFGDPATKETVWLIRTHAEIAKFVRAGENLLALRVVDHQGAGGLHRRVWLATAPPSTDDSVQR